MTTLSFLVGEWLLCNKRAIIPLPVPNTGVFNGRPKWHLILCAKTPDPYLFFPTFMSPYLLVIILLSQFVGIFIVGKF